MPSLLDAEIASAERHAEEMRHRAEEAEPQGLMTIAAIYRKAERLSRHRVAVLIARRDGRAGSHGAQDVEADSSS